MIGFQLRYSPLDVADTTVARRDKRISCENLVFAAILSRIGTRFSKKEKSITHSTAILPAARLPCSIGVVHCAAEENLPGPRNICRVELQSSDRQTVRCSTRRFDPRAMYSGNRFSGRTQLIKSFGPFQRNRGNFRSLLSGIRKTKHVIEGILDCPATMTTVSQRASSTWGEQSCIGG